MSLKRPKFHSEIQLDTWNDKNHFKTEKNVKILTKLRRIEVAHWLGLVITSTFEVD